MKDLEITFDKENDSLIIEMEIKCRYSEEKSRIISLVFYNDKVFLSEGFIIIKCRNIESNLYYKLNKFLMKYTHYNP